VSAAMRTSTWERACPLPAGSRRCRQRRHTAALGGNVGADQRECRSNSKKRMIRGGIAAPLYEIYLMRPPSALAAVFFQFAHEEHRLFAVGGAEAVGAIFPIEPLDHFPSADGCPPDRAGRSSPLHDSRHHFAIAVPARDSMTFKSRSISVALMMAVVRRHGALGEAKAPEQMVEADTITNKSRPTDDDLAAVGDVESKLSCERMTPFGCRSIPRVYIIVARSCACTDSKNIRQALALLRRLFNQLSEPIVRGRWALLLP